MHLQKKIKKLIEEEVREALAKKRKVRPKSRGSRPKVAKRKQKIRYRYVYMD